MKNPPPTRQEEQRSIILECDSHGVFVRCRLWGVIHGCLDITDEVPGTLIVFEFRLLASSLDRRIKSATLTIRFADEDGNAAYDPEVVGLAPQGDLRLFPTTMIESKTTEGLMVREYTKESYMTLIGAARYENQGSGGVNGVLWFLRENEFTQEGVAPILRAAVLLRRIPGSNDRRFRAHVGVKAEVIGGSILSGLMPRSLDCTGAPLIFNPRLPATRLDKLSISSDNLRVAKLKALALVELFPRVDATSSPADEVELTPTAVDGKTWSEGSTKNQILLNFAKGQYSQLSYKFKRFETLAIFNIYNYQHKLVELGKRMNETEYKMEEQDANELARLLREYHEAIKAFTELARFERPSAEIARATAESLAIKLEEPFYSTSDDITDIIDVKGEPKTDSVRNWIQNGLMRLQTRDIRQILLNMSLADIGHKRVGHSLLLHPIPPAPTHVSKVADKLASIVVAFVGGAFLLAPMYNLTYVQDQKYQLISVVLWVFFFATSLALSSNATNQELLGATAAYAAVLVVFVGQNPTTG